MKNVDFLRLLQLSDSALPIGGAAHSFGLETLAAADILTVDCLAEFLADYLRESGVLESAYCIRASEGISAEEWVELNQQLSALRPAWESRKASIVLGRRFLQLAASLGIEGPVIAADVDAHLCTAFGWAARELQIDSTVAATAFLHQNVAAILSACQRLMPLGQHRAARVLWDLKPNIIEAVETARCADYQRASNFVPMLDIASMQHPFLTTRLFIS